MNKPEQKSLVQPKPTRLTKAKRLLMLALATSVVSMIGCAMPSAGAPIFPSYQPTTAAYPANLPQQGAAAPERPSFFNGFQTNFRKNSSGTRGSC